MDVGGDEIRAWGTDHRSPATAKGRHVNMRGRPLAGMISRQKRKSQSRSLVIWRYTALTKRYVRVVADGEDENEWGM